MTKVLLNLTFGVFAGLVIQTSQAAGFGIEFGSSPNNYGCTSLGEGGKYTCTDVPKPHSSFESYVIQASDQHGICWVKGVGKDISDNGYGTSTKRKLEELKASLERGYGPASETTDFLIYGALWDDSDEWLMSIRQKQRVFMYQWDAPEGQKYKLDKIYLAAGATGSDTGYIALDYYSSDHEACTQATSKLEDDSL